MFQSHGNADKAGRDIDGRPFFRAELCVGGAGRVGGDAAGISQVGCLRQHLQVVQEFTAGFESSFQLETEDASAIEHLFFGDGMLGVAGEEGVFEE